jgi:hypothetical protein
MTVRSTLRVALLLGSAIGSLAAGCGGGSDVTGSAGSGGTGAAGGSGGGLAAACGLETRVGGFAVQLVETAGSPSYTSIAGGVRNGVDPRDVWREKGTAAGGCRLIVGPGLVCTTPCATPQICAGQNQCVDQPTLQNIGTVTVTGVGASPITIMPLQNTYSSSLTDPYPPFSPGGTVRVQAAGGAGPAFTLEAGAIEPLTFEGANLTLRNGEAMSFTWTPPATASAARIQVGLEIGHHGGVAAEIECDFPDTGLGQIPASLVSALIAEGTHGFPTISLARRTTASASVAGGCVELAVVATVQRAITVCPTASSCIVSCDPGDPAGPCPSPMTCRADFTCG